MTKKIVLSSLATAWAPTQAGLISVHFSKIDKFYLFPRSTCKNHMYIILELVGSMFSTVCKVNQVTER